MTSRTGPLTRGDAARLQIPLHDLLSPAYRRVFHGVYVRAGMADSTELRARAALRLAPDGAVVSHHTAAELWGGIVPRHPDVHLLRVGGSRWAGPAGVTLHRAREMATSHRHGLPVTTPERTFLDLAGHLSLVDLVVLADSLIRRNQTTSSRLLQAAEGPHVRWRQLARRAASLARDGVDSPQESRLRMLVVLAGLPEPRVNYIFRRDDGSWERRSELVWEELKIALEFDGRQHAESTRQWDEDIDRREFLDDLEWRMIVVRGPGLTQHADQTLRRILKIRAARGAAGPRRIRPEWERHFPGHRQVR